MPPDHWNGGFEDRRSPLAVDGTGPLKGNTISGGFTVYVKGAKIGEGVLSITRGPGTEEPQGAEPGDRVTSSLSSGSPVRWC